MVKKSSNVASKPTANNDVIEDVEIIEESTQVQVKGDKLSKED